MTSTRARLERYCEVEHNETFPDRHDTMRVEVTLGDLRKLLAVLNAAQACEGHITTHGEQHLTDDLWDALGDVDQSLPGKLPVMGVGGGLAGGPSLLPAAKKRARR